MKNPEELAANFNENKNQTVSLDEFLKNIDIQSIIGKHIPKIGMDIAQFESLKKGSNLTFFAHQKTLAEQANENPDLKNFLERTGAIRHEEEEKLNMTSYF